MMTSTPETEAATDQPIKSYKGMDKDMRCRGFQFALGATYEQPGPIAACENGFHACEHPLNVFEYYAPSDSRFFAVTQSGEISRKAADDTKIASAKITIDAELKLPEIIAAAIRWVFDRASPEKGSVATGYQGAASSTGCQGAASSTGCQGAASSTGYQGAASSTGDRGAASSTGDRGAASSTGDRGAASSTGDQGAASSTGCQGAAMAVGHSGRVMGKDGNALFLTYRDPYTSAIIHAWAGIVGQNGIKSEVWYILGADGLPVEVTP
jgi:hypothetical protein